MTPPGERPVIPAVPLTELRPARIAPEVLQSISVTSTEAALDDFVRARSQLVHSDAALEGGGLTLEQVQKVIADEPLPDADAFDVAQAVSLRDTTVRLQGLVASDTFSLTLDLSDELHRIVAELEAIDAGIRRWNSAVNADGKGATVNVRGQTFIGYRRDDLRVAADAMVSLVASLEHPVEQALNYAALATYLQMYFDGNKRTSRMMMQGHLLAHGYRAIVIPVEQEPAYVDAVAAMFTTGQMHSYVGFLAGLAAGRQ